MKNAIPFILIFLALILKDVYTQDNSTKKMIILTSGDTLNVREIINNKTVTNQDGIAYYDNNNQEHKLNSSQIKAYYSNNKFFHSERIQDEGIQRLVSYVAAGNILFGYSYTSKGEMNFYVKKNEIVICLEKYQFDLETFFKSYLEDFEQFRAKYKSLIFYDYKTLAELISAYNAFRFPEQYVFESFWDKETLKIGVIVSCGGVNTNLSGYYNSSLTGMTYSIGADFNVRYSRISSLHIPITYTYGKAKSSLAATYHSSLNLEPYLTVRTLTSKKLSLEIGAGGGLLFNVYSYLDGSRLIESELYKVNFNILGLGANLTAIANLNKRMSAQIMFAHHKMRTGNMKISAIESTSMKVRTNNLRLMISYYF